MPTPCQSRFAVGVMCLVLAAGLWNTATGQQLPAEARPDPGDTLRLPGDPPDLSESQPGGDRVIPDAEYYPAEDAAGSNRGEAGDAGEPATGNGPLEPEPLPATAGRRSYPPLRDPSTRPGPAVNPPGSVGHQSVVPHWGLGGCQPPKTLFDFGSDINFGTPVLDPLWVSLEYLGWAMKRSQLPAVVTTSPLGTPADEAGVLGLDSNVLFGDQSIHKKLRSGGRLRGGFWFTPARLDGLEGSYFGVDGHDVAFRAVGDGDRILARPYQNAVTGAQASLLTAYPGQLDGTLQATADLEFSGAEALYRRVLYREPAHQLDLLLGYRYGRLYDQFRTHESLVSLDVASGFPEDAEIERTDLFRVVNHFHGGQLGLQRRWLWNSGLGLSLLGKAGLGTTYSRFHVDGSTVVREPVVNQTTGQTSLEITETHDGGLLTQPSNRGVYETSEMAFLGELGVTLEYIWSRDVRISFGYTFVYWSEVARALDHVDTTVNPTQFRSGTLDGPARPDFRFSLGDFWAQGLNAGLEIDF